MSRQKHIAMLRSNRRGTACFTLSEVMIASAIGTLMLVGIMTTYVLSVRAYQGINNYAQIHGDGRKAIDRFALDMRSVSSVQSMNNSMSNATLVVTVPTNFVGSVPLNTTVTYTWSGGAFYRTDSSTGRTSLLATNVYSAAFSLYDKNLSSTNVVAQARCAQVDIKLRKYVANMPQTEDYLSARLAMRNTP